jgi:hypothetical protein
VIDDVKSLREVRERRVKRLEIKVSAAAVTEERLSRLAELARNHAGATPIAMSILLPGEAERVREIGAQQLRVVETGSEEMRLAQVRVPEPCPCKVGVQQERSFHLRFSEVRALHVRVSEYRLLQVNSSQVRLLQVNLAQDGSCEFCSG